MLFALRTRILGGIALVGLAACTNSNAVVSTPSTAAANATMIHTAGKAASYTTKYVQIVMFENKDYDQIIGSPKAPYISGLSQQWANMTQSFAVRHPSEPNYVALFSGSTEGLASDWCPRTYYGVSLGSELLDAGISFRGYAESMPSDGFEGCQGTPDKLDSGWLYKRKHNPWADFTKIPRKDSVVYHEALSRPPARFVWITPNMCNDMHDCGVSVGDAWASRNLPKLIAWDQAHQGVLILTFDENDGSPGNQIPTILMGNVNPGQYSQTIDHYNVLRTIEDVFGVKPINNANSVGDIEGVIK
ncbi:MAG TPA: alkaline phosphatase family protein [Candidatus Tumulicola sp.]|jgi:acid phosphatase